MESTEFQRKVFKGPAKFNGKQIYTTEEMVREYLDSNEHGQLENLGVSISNSHEMIGRILEVLRIRGLINAEEILVILGSTYTFRIATQEELKKEEI